MSWVRSWPARPTNGIALQVLLRSRALADEHEVGGRIADAEHHLACGPGSRAGTSCRRAPSRSSSSKRRERRFDHERHALMAMPSSGHRRPGSRRSRRRRRRPAGGRGGRRRPPGGQGEGDVAVEARVRREDRPAHRRGARSGRRGGTRSWSRRASVATTTSVVCSPSTNGSGVRERRGVRAAPSIPPAGGRRRRPRRRPRSRRRARRPRASSTRADADPRPPGTPWSAPCHFPTVAPVPAPTCPVATSPRARRRRRRRTPSSGPGRTPPELDEVEDRAPPARSGPVPPAVEKPRPCASSERITPSAAASPNAEPPVSTTASTCSTSRCGSSSAISRLAGAPPRTSPDPTVPAGTSDDGDAGAVAGPVPDPMPGTSVIRRRPPRGERGTDAPSSAPTGPEAPQRRAGADVACELGDERVDLVGALEHEHVAGAAEHLEPRAGDQLGDAPRLRRRCDDVGAPADHERRDPDLGQLAVRSRPTSAVTASWLAAFGHAAIISRTSSTWLACGSRPKPMRARKKPRFGWVTARRPSGPPPVRRSNDLAQPSARRTGTSSRESRAARCRARARRRPRGSATRTTAPRCRPSSGRRAPRRAGRGARARCGRRRRGSRSSDPLSPALGIAVAAVVERDAPEPLLGQRLELLHPGPHRERDAVREHDRRALAAADRVDAAAVVTRERDAPRRTAGRAPCRRRGRAGVARPPRRRARSRRRRRRHRRPRRRRHPRPAARVPSDRAARPVRHQHVPPGHARADAADDLVGDRAERARPTRRR